MWSVSRVLKWENVDSATLLLSIRAKRRCRGMSEISGVRASPWNSASNYPLAVIKHKFAANTVNNFLS